MAPAALFAILAAAAVPASSPKVAAPVFSSFIGASAAGLRDRMGDPDVARMEGRGGMWTYRLQGCALFVFFHQEEGKARVSGAATGPRRRGDPPVSVDACLATAVLLPPHDVLDDPGDRGGAPR